MPMLRRQFLQVEWDASDLDSVAEFWTRHADAARRSPAEYGHLELIVAGVSEAETPGLLSRLERIVAAIDPEGTVQPERDLITASLIVPLDQELPAGLGTGWLSDRGDDKLAVILKWRTGGSARAVRRQLAIVIAGDLERDQMVVKAVWLNRDPGDDAAYVASPFEYEDLLLDAYDRYARDGKINDRVVEWFPRPRAGIRIDRWLMMQAAKLWWVPQGSPRLKGLLIRLPFMAALLVAEIVLLLNADEFPFKHPVQLARALGGIACVYFLGNFALQEWGFFSTFKQLRDNIRKTYEVDPGFRIREPEYSERFSRDPAVRKFTKDLLAAGFRMAGDVTAEHWPSTYRGFLAPDGITYFVLIAWTKYDDGDQMVRSWPATVSFQAQTFFTNGGRVDSQTSECYRRVPVEPGTLIRSTPAASLFEFIESHQRATEVFASSQGLTPCRHEPLTRYLERQQEIFEADAEHALKGRYSVQDHLRWYLQMPYSEIQTPA